MSAYVVPLSIYFWYQRSDLPDGRETPRQKYTTGLILDHTGKIRSEISPTSS